MEKVNTAEIKLWGYYVGAVSWLHDRQYSLFEYDPSFLKKDLDISPIHMSIKDAKKSREIFSFPSLSKDTFLGLPGMLADALPDKFGNSIINSWLARQGRDIESSTPVERLCYMGKRAVGALEFSPAIIDNFDRPVSVEIPELVKLTKEILDEGKKLNVRFTSSDKENEQAILDILRVGTSAGGARAKAVIAMNKSGDILSGQTEVPGDYDYWILKFDGVEDVELGKTKDHGRIEYAYHLMAKNAGIEMTRCELLEENGRSHFMTRRFDRVDGKKIHMQTLCGIAHYDFNLPGTYSYELAFTVMRKLKISKREITEQYRRMLFNVFARNQDDHTKNISFLMEENGKWKLSPAYDLIYSHNPQGQWTRQHQMTINGKRDNFHIEDLLTVGETIGINKPKDIISEVREAVENWGEFARKAGLKNSVISEIGKSHRMKELVLS